MKKVLLFDYDGVIVNSLPVITRVYNRLFEKYNLNLHYTQEEFSMFYIDNFHKSLAKKAPADLLLTILKEKGEEFIRCKNEFKLFPGIRAVLVKLADRCEVIIISSNTTELIKQSMKLNRLDFIGEVIGGDIEPSKVKKINAQKNKHPGSELLYIGDTVGDINEAKKAGVATVAVTWGFHSKELLEKEKPDYLFDRPEDLLILMRFSS